MKSRKLIRSGWNNNRWLIQVKLSAAFTLITILLGCSSSADQNAAPPPPIVPVGQVMERSLETFNEYPASIEGHIDIEIRPQVSGYLQTVFVEEGAYVSAGQSLFKINEQPYRQALNNAKASLHSSQAATLNAQIEVDKLVPLVENKVVSGIQLKTAQTAYKIAKANEEQAQANVAAANINLGYTNVKSTVSGFIGRIPKKQGSLVSPSDEMALTRLSDIRTVYVYFSLGENDFSVFNMNFKAKDIKTQLKNLPKVELLLSNDSVYSEKGVIDMIDGQFDKNTGSIMLRASFTNKRGELRSGNTGRIRLGIPHQNILLVPQSSTVEMQDKVFVYAVASGNKVVKKPIQIIGKSGSNYLIKDGLRSGEQIILSGFDHLQEGQVVQPEKSVDKTAKTNH